MNPEEYKQAIADIEEEDRNRQETFDEETQAYLAKNATDDRDTLAASMDTNTTEFPSLLTDDRFEFATPNWNDRLTDAEIFKACGEVSDTLKRMPDTRPP